MDKPIDKYFRKGSMHSSRSVVICIKCGAKVNDQGLAKVNHVANCPRRGGHNG